MNYELAIYLLRFGVALTMLAFGINQLLQPGKWLQYMPEFLKRSSLLSPETGMRLHACGNIVFALWLASGLFPYVGAWVAFVWWLSILPFAFKVSWQIGMRDLSITAALGALIALLK